jgi:hypothetical protein
MVPKMPKLLLGSDTVPWEKSDGLLATPWFVSSKL